MLCSYLLSFVLWVFFALVCCCLLWLSLCFWGCLFALAQFQSYLCLYLQQIPLCFDLSLSEATHCHLLPRGDGSVLYVLSEDSTRGRQMWMAVGGVLYLLSSFGPQLRFHKTLLRCVTGRFQPCERWRKRSNGLQICNRLRQSDVVGDHTSLCDAQITDS